MLVITMLSLLAQDAEKTKVDPAAAAAEIQEALKSKDPAAAAEVIAEKGRTADAAVVKAVAEGLHSKEAEVREAALAALRYNEAPEAFDPLLKLARDQKVMAEPQFAAKVYLALGQKGDPKALPVLAEDLTVDDGGSRVIQARVLAMGRVRNDQALEELMNFLVKGRGRAAHPYWREVNLSLAALTGLDLGGRDAWQEWWNEHRNEFKVEPKQPKLPPRVEAAWNAVWSAEGEGEAPAKGKGKAGGRGKSKDQAP